MGGGGDPTSFGQSKAKSIKGEKTKTKFNDVSGLDEPMRLEIKIRHQATSAWAVVAPAKKLNTVEVTFDSPQRAVTPGQAAVFYQEDIVVGGGWIQ